MSAFLSHQPTDLDSEVDCPWVWKIHMNPLSGPNAGPVYELSEDEMHSIVKDFFLILDREADE